MGLPLKPLQTPGGDLLEWQAEDFLGVEAPAANPVARGANELPRWTRDLGAWMDVEHDRDGRHVSPFMPRRAVLIAWNGLLYEVLAQYPLDEEFTITREEAGLVKVEWDTALPSSSFAVEASTVPEVGAGGVVDQRAEAWGLIDGTHTQTTRRCWVARGRRDDALPGPFEYADGVIAVRVFHP